MPLTFYPHADDVQKGSLLERIEILMEAADRYKAVILDVATSPITSTSAVSTEVNVVKRITPRDLAVAFNWDEVARILREVRELSESSKGEKQKKGSLLAKLAEVYEVLRAAKMSKLEAVRLALINEANQLRGGSSQQVA